MSLMVMKKDVLDAIETTEYDAATKKFLKHRTRATSALEINALGAAAAESIPTEFVSDAAREVLAGFVSQMLAEATAQAEAAAVVQEAMEVATLSESERTPVIDAPAPAKKARRGRR